MKIPEKLDNKQLVKVLKKQIRLCFMYRHFRSLIFISQITKRNIVFEYLNFLCNQNWFIRRNITRIKNNSNETLICFKNGSFIRVITGRESSVRGHRANNVVIDTDIINRYVVCCIRPTIIDLLIVPSKFAMKVLKIKPHHKKQFKKREYWVKI